MGSRIASSCVIACAIVASALLLRSAPELRAGSEFPRPVSFVATVAAGETVVLGHVPSSRTLTLHDFHLTSPDFTLRFELLADGVPAAPALRVADPGSGNDDGSHHISFHVGFELTGGQELAIRSLSSRDGTMYVRGFLE